MHKGLQQIIDDLERLTDEIPTRVPFTVIPNGRDAEAKRIYKYLHWWNRYQWRDPEFRKKFMDDLQAKMRSFCLYGTT